MRRQAIWKRTILVLVLVILAMVAMAYGILMPGGVYDGWLEYRFRECCDVDAGYKLVVKRGRYGVLRPMLHSGDPRQELIGAVFIGTYGVHEGVPYLLEFLTDDSRAMYGALGFLYGLPWSEKIEDSVIEAIREVKNPEALTQIILTFSKANPQGRRVPARVFDVLVERCKEFPDNKHVKSALKIATKNYSQRQAEGQAVTPPPKEANLPSVKSDTVTDERVQSWRAHWRSRTQKQAATDEDAAK